MSKGKLIKVCGECANYDWKKHRCKLGCNEGEPQEPFFTDCPLPTVDTKSTEWISVDERFPERIGYYLTYTIRGTIEISRFYPFYVNDTPQFDYWITHWMPLPEPPMMKGE